MSRDVQIQETPLEFENIDNISIPDLWHIAEMVGKTDEGGATMIIDCWHLAHMLKKHIIKHCT